MTAVALGLDVGTGSTKAGLVDLDGRLRSVRRAAHPIDTPDTLRSESRPDEWLRSMTSAVRELCAERPDDEVVCIGLSGQMHGVVCVDPDGTALRPAVLWSDRRAQVWLADARPRFSDELLARLGNPLVAGMAGPILAALGRSEPEAIDSARWFLQPKDWVRLQLTGEVATDPSDASATLLWDVVADGWSRDAAEAFEVAHHKLPPVVASGVAAGVLGDGMARRLGLRAGIPVAAGAADTAAALLGAGVPVGESQVSIGTGGQIARVLDAPAVDPTRRTHLYRAAADGRWYAMAAIHNAGIAIDWAGRVLAPTGDEISAALSRPSSEVESAVVFLPYLTGERTPHLDGGLTGRWVGLTPAVTREALIRSVYDGVAFALRDALDALRDAGHTLDRALLAGGGSRDPAWQQVLADALAIPLAVHDVPDASVRGAGLLGWQALDIEVAAQGPRTSREVSPGPCPEAALFAFRQAAAERSNA